MHKALTLPAVAFTLASAGAGVVIAYRATAPDPVAVPGLACRLPSAALSRLELFFGMARKGGAPITDAEWTAFLDAEVTPRFPDGLTVLAASGQWRNGAGGITKEPSRMLIVWYRPAADTDSKIEAIRAAYKDRFQQESVMRVDGSACVSF